jgi:nucleoid-associated protein YgaU
LSRYTFTTAAPDAEADLVLYGEEPYRFRDLADNRRHLVKQGDTLHALASQFFAKLPRPAGLWWVIADFQPEPIHDPTRKLTPGRVLVIPSLRTVQEEILSERRRRA